MGKPWEKYASSQSPAPWQKYQKNTPPDMAEISAALPDAPIGQSPQQQFDNLSWWQKPIVAADDLATIAGNDATFGYLPKAAAAIRSKVKGTSYDEELAPMRKQVEDARQRAGGAGMVAGIGASVAPVAAAAKVGLTAQAIPKVPKFVGSLMDGAGLGALMAHGNDQDVLTGAGLGFLGGAAGDVFSKGANKVATMLAERGKIPSLDAITKKATELYNGVKAEGVTYSNDAAKGLVSGIQKEFADKTFEPILEPGADRVLRVLTERVNAGNPMTAEGLHAVRSAANDQFIPGNNRNSMLLNILKGKVDDFLQTPQGAITGDAVKAAGMKKEADALWSQKKKIETVRAALSKAESRAARTGSGGNTENTVKQELAKILESPKKGRGFTPDEKAMVEDVIFNQSGRDALRLVGKLSPFKHGGAAALGVGGLMVEPVTALTAMGLGTGSKMLGNAIQRSKASQIEKLIAVGGNKANLPAPSAKQKSAIEAIARALMLGGPALTQN